MDGNLGKVLVNKLFVIVSAVVSGSLNKVPIVADRSGALSNRSARWSTMFVGTFLISTVDVVAS